MPENKKYISVIIPTYNRNYLLIKAVESIIRQKGSELFCCEIIIVDDGSSDNSHELIHQIKVPEHIHLKYIYQENQGVGKARNTGIKEVSPISEYITFLDSDDELMDDCLETVIKKFKEYEISGLYNQLMGVLFFCQDENGSIIGRREIAKNTVDLKYDYAMYLSRKIDWEVHSIIKTDIYRKNPDLRFPEGVTNESILWSSMWKWLDSKKMYGVLLPYVGRLYRTQHGQGQITKTISIERFMKNALGNEQVLDIIGEDLLSHGFKRQYSEIKFRAGINWILYGDLQRGRKLLMNSIRIKMQLTAIVLLILSFLNKRILLLLYSLYIK